MAHVNCVKQHEVRCQIIAG